MPTFYQEAEIDVDVDEFLDCCSRREKEQLIKALKKGDLWAETPSETANVMDLQWNEALAKLANARLRLTNEEEELIKKIANRF